MTPSSYVCSECHGAFPTEATLAQHVDEHQLLRQLRSSGTAPPPTRRLSLPPLVTKSAAPPVAASNEPPIVTVASLPATATTKTRTMAPGVVDFFDETKGFGFLKRSAAGAPARQVFFHIKSCDVKNPLPVVGEVVSFSEERGPKGPMATSVVRQNVPAMASIASPSGVIAVVATPTSGQPAARPLAPTGGLALLPGVVQHFNAVDRTGFLSSVAGNDAGKNVAFDITVCDLQTPAPCIGERVLFAQTESPRAVATTVVRTDVNTTTSVAGAAASPVTSTPTPALDMGEQPDVRPAARLLGPVKAKFQKLARVPALFEGGANPRYVYVDLDNIYVSFVRADHLASVFPGAATARDLQLDLVGLTRRLAAGETGGGPARLVAFYYHTPEPIAAKLRTLSYNGVQWDVRKQETTSDTSMQLELLIAKQPCSAHPKTLVLVTGDGNVAPNGMCFREIMDKYLRDAWAVEVHAWMCSMAASYIEFQREYAKVVVIRPLDDEHVAEVVRIRGKASSKVPALGDPVPAVPVQPAVKSAAEKPVGGRTGKHAKPQPSPPKPTKTKKNPEPKNPRNTKANVAATRDDVGDDEEKAAARGSDDNDEDDADEIELDGRAAFTAALMQAVEEARVASVPTPSSPARMPPPTTAVPVEPQRSRQPTTTIAPTTYRPDQFRQLIQQLEGADGELFIPTAITVLATCDANTDVASIQAADIETQRMLLVLALTDAMDAAVTAAASSSPVRADPPSASIEVQRPAPVPVPAPPTPTTTTASYSPDQFRQLIQQLEGFDGELFIPTAIAVLTECDANTDVASIQAADVETQRMLLVLALTDAMDTATWRFIHADDADA